MNNIKDFIQSIPNLSFAYLFGSRASNTHKEESDFDVCFIIKNENKNETRKSIVDFLLSNKEFIQPLIFTEEEFNDKMKIDVYKNEILRRGIKIEKIT